MASLPIFALPNLTLFEGAHLPNRLFETRYLEMMEDTYEAGKNEFLFGTMVGDWELHYFRKAKLLPYATRATFTYAHQEENEIWAVHIHGLERVRLGAEVETPRLYRAFEFEPAPTTPLSPQKEDLTYQRILSEINLHAPNLGLGKEEYPNSSSLLAALATAIGLSGAELGHLFCLPRVQEQVSFILDASKEALLTKRALDSLPSLDSPRDIGDGGGSEN